jgi:hypothetical protein
MPRHGVGLNESLCDLAKPSEVTLFLGICWRRQSGAGKHCLEREQFAAMTVTEAKSAADPEHRPTGANSITKRVRSGANNYRERCLAERRAA